MSRYIDADAFLKEYCEPYPHVYMAMSKAMTDAPTIDIVRCKECKHKSNGYEFMWCDHEHGMDMVKPDDYCSYGERSKP